MDGCIVDVSLPKGRKCVLSPRRGHAQSGGGRRGERLRLLLRTLGGEGLGLVVTLSDIHGFDRSRLG